MDRGGEVPLASFPLDVVAEISQTSYYAAAFGDTDHDGLNEVVVGWYDNSGDGRIHYWILEERGSNVYSAELTGGRLTPYAVGDLDQDGKAEIIGQDAYQIWVYEALDATSYPTQLVWTSPSISNTIGHTRVADTDRDGRMEIIHSQNFGGGSGNLLIFENTADNAFSLVYSAPTVGSPSTADKVIADLDGDGLIEIATSGTYGRVYVFESTGDNQWQQTWTTETGMINAYGMEGGVDTDGNGKPELFVYGNYYTGVQWEWTTMVFEAVADNQFAQVASFGRYDGFGGYAFNTLGDLDGDGGMEYVMQGHCCLWIYQAVRVGAWQLVEETPKPNTYQNSLYSFDVNRNGREELFWFSEWYPSYTLVLEHGPRTAAVGEHPSPTLRSIVVSPNPFRGEASLRVSTGADGATRLAIYDVGGRLVQRHAVARGPGGQLLWQAGRTIPGVYWLRLEDGSGAVLASGRAILVR